MKKNYSKMIWDLAMLILLILLMEAKAIGQQFHEIAGLLIGAVFIFHIILNWQFVRKTTPKLWSNQIKTRTRIIYVLDLVLFLSFLIVIVSGVLSSKVLFPYLHYGNTYVLKILHQSVSYTALLLVGLHLGLNWNWVMSTSKKLIGFKTNAIMNYISKAMAVVILLFGIYSIMSVNLISNIVNLTGVVEVDQYSNFEEGITKPNQNGSEDSGNPHNGHILPGGKFQNGPVNGHGPGNTGEARPGGQGPGPAGRSMGSTNFLLKLGTYLGVVSGFAVMSYYLDLLFNRKKIKPVV